MNIVTMLIIAVIAFIAGGVLTFLWTRNSAKGKAQLEEALADAHKTINDLKAKAAKAVKR